MSYILLTTARSGGLPQLLSGGKGTKPDQIKWYLNSYPHVLANLPAFAVFCKIFVFMLPIGPIDPPCPGMTFDDIFCAIRVKFVRHLEVLQKWPRKSSKITKIRYGRHITDISEAPVRVIILVKIKISFYVAEQHNFKFLDHWFTWLTHENSLKIPFFRGNDVIENDVFWEVFLWNWHILLLTSYIFMFY